MGTQEVSYPALSGMDGGSETPLKGTKKRLLTASVESDPEEQEKTGLEATSKPTYTHSEDEWKGPGAQKEAGKRSESAVERIVKIADNNPYLILGVNDPCSKGEAYKAYRKLSLLIHPDKCKHKNAKTVFIKSKEASNRLCLEEELLDCTVFPEEDNNGPYTEEDNSRPGAFQQHIYTKATSCIQSLFSDLKSSDLDKKIWEYNKLIRVKNMKDVLSFKDHERYIICLEVLISDVNQLHQILGAWLSRFHYSSDWIVTFRVENYELKFQFGDKDAVEKKSQTTDADGDTFMEASDFLETLLPVQTQQGQYIVTYASFQAWNKVLKQYISFNIKFIVQTKPESCICKFLSMKYSPLRCELKFKKKDVSGNVTEYGGWITRTEFCNIMVHTQVDNIIVEVYRSESAIPPWTLYGLVQEASALEKANHMSELFINADLPGLQTAASSVHTNVNTGRSLSMISSTLYMDAGIAEIENQIKLLQLQAELQRRRKQDRNTRELVHV
ncbi:hypothetical protein ACJ72_04162 [Emergomyces africanus]|uniref:J domain-containing protein n=1 Tax=Emergomyces africanus TaxID=1955775 RepID=A0A1B7NXK6_9EURO|nr:hypothetical protein ACJ72_04162 [Emergomyces africanus]